MSAPPGCSVCRDGKVLDFPISMAFQPIVDLPRRQVFAHEALVRGNAGESAGSLLARVDGDNRYAFDQSCRIAAVEWAARLQVPARVSINFMPNAVYRAETCIRATLDAAALPLSARTDHLRGHRTGASAGHPPPHRHPARLPQAGLHDRHR